MAEIKSPSHAALRPVASPNRHSTNRLQPVTGPSAELRTVPAARQELVNQAVRRSLTAKLEGRVAPGRQAAVNELIAHVGSADFYERVAVYDTKHAAQWREMAKVQQRFAAAEPSYDAHGRAYSESMRLTLHAALVQHFADPTQDHGMPMYERFITLHPTAFHQNGGWVDNLHLSMCEAFAVAQATPLPMYFHLHRIIEGSFINDAPTVTAAQWVREARAEALQGWAR